MSSDTPRTDALNDRWLNADSPMEAGSVSADALRSHEQLEREHAALSERVAELDKANTGLAEEVRILRHRLDDLVEAFDGSADMDEMDGPEYAEASAKLESAIEAARPHTEKALLDAAMRGTGTQQNGRTQEMPAGDNVRGGSTPAVGLEAGKADAAPAGMVAEDYKALYHDLLMSVGNKHPGETRHETAKRYILNAERWTSTAGQVAAKGKQ